MDSAVLAFAAVGWPLQCGWPVFLDGCVPSVPGTRVCFYHRTHMFRRLCIQTSDLWVRCPPVCRCACTWLRWLLPRTLWEYLQSSIWRILYWRCPCFGTPLVLQARHKRIQEDPTQIKTEWKKFFFSYQDAIKSLNTLILRHFGLGGKVTQKFFIFYL